MESLKSKMEIVFSAAGRIAKEKLKVHRRVYSSDKFKNEEEKIEGLKSKMEKVFSAADSVSKEKLKVHRRVYSSYKFIR